MQKIKGFQQKLAGLIDQAMRRRPHREDPCYLRGADMAEFVPLPRI